MFNNREIEGVEDHCYPFSFFLCKNNHRVENCTENIRTKTFLEHKNIN